ncbi:MAG: DHH family phosphoesterase [Hominimerdicola sp.]
MKGYNGQQIILYVTIAVIALGNLIASIMLRGTPSGRDMGGVLLIIAIVGTLLLLVEFFFFKNHTKKYIAEMSTLISKTERDSLLHFPAPAIIIDQSNVIVWYNRAFANEVYSEEEAYGIVLSEAINIDMDRIFDRDGDLICFNKHFYNVKAVHTDKNGMLSMVYFEDVTDFIELEYETKQSHKSVVIVMIDNYDDLMSNIRESEKAHVAVEIEKLIENFIDGTTAVSKKVSSDKFFIFIEERHLAPIIEKRFKILEEARRITVGERSNLSLSIGVGREGNNLAESEKLAKQALELCLGRGGDQAAVRENGEFKFFGGISNSADSNNRVKIRMFAKALEELIASHEKILIMGHHFGDLDSVGTATGLCCAIRKIVRNSYVVVNPEQNLAKSLINYINESEGSSYYITPKEGLDFLDNETLLIIVDTHNPELVESKDILNCAKQVVVIDHHRRMVNGIEPTVMAYLEPGASSAAELVTEFIEYFSTDVTISVKAAEALLAGIMLDTKNFVMKTGVNTFEAAAYLKKRGADTIAVKKLFANTIETYHQKSALINTAEIYRKCAIASTSEQFSNIRIAASQAADELLGITGVNASFVLYESNGTVNISARSLGGFNVQVVMEALGGGGHLTMAATQMKTTLEDAKNQLNEAIDDYIRNNS